MSMITASLWAPRGAPATFPTKYNVDEEELARISRLAKLQLEDAKKDLDTARNGGPASNGREETSDDEDEKKEGDVKMSQSNG